MRLGNVLDLEQLRLLVIAGHLQHGDASDEQCIVCKRRKKLRRHDDVETEWHAEKRNPVVAVGKLFGAVLYHNLVAAVRGRSGTNE